jgi:hypothetical protein
LCIGAFTFLLTQVCLLFIAITGKHSITSGKNNPSPFLAETLPPFPTLQKKLLLLFSTVGTERFLFLAEKLATSSSETGVPIIVGASVSPLP